ncbi:helix-turn-helix transcriptional regulator [Phragmitibacter flavus]|uniref:Helix-turn-helix transcriptional regulator n=1 Tax=Phragmitibacter flavus TaxID=2576071 RepID=A0A5R8KBW8_9BACT|nr:helix-turn-helix transcriptional regulator [Phragmitibacter flavus]TLD69810.1 helix-turn-helix transcriptional regulator [Phragmitibacter flavus]
MIVNQMADEPLLQELGARLMAVRLGRNLTQAQLAREAGVSKRTLERLEAGEVAVQLTGLIRVLRVLDLLEGLNQLVPEPVASPMEELKLRGRRRKRATGTRGGVGGGLAEEAAEYRVWKWGDER